LLPSLAIKARYSVLFRTVKAGANRLDCPVEYGLFQVAPLSWEDIYIRPFPRFLATKTRCSIPFDDTARAGDLLLSCPI